MAHLAQSVYPTKRAKSGNLFSLNQEKQKGKETNTAFGVMMGPSAVRNRMAP